MNGQTNTDKRSSIYSYHLTLFSDTGGMHELWLPMAPEGFFRFSQEPRHRFLSICAKDGRWVATCQKPAFFKEVPLADSYEITLSESTFLKISMEDRTYLMLTEKAIPSRSIFRHYKIRPGITVTVGSQPECDIYYRGPFVARKHAALCQSNGQWSARCFDEQYGIYVNGKKTDEAKLTLGDVVYITGLKIIIGADFLSINSGLGDVVVNSRILQEDPILHGSYSHYYGQEPAADANRFFNRAPRKRRESEQKVITVEGPPMSMSQKQMPLMLRMGSSMVMGSAAALAGNFMSLISGVLFPFMSSKYSDSQRQEYEKLRQTKYTEYLQKKRHEILDALRIEQQELNIKYPPLEQVAALEQLDHLWERRPGDSDFLQLRLGTGTRHLSANIDYPPRGFTLETDALEEKMYQLVEAVYKVDKVPVVLSLTDTYVCGIQGEREQVLEMIRNLVTQLTVFHSYDEVKTVFLLGQQDLEHLDSLRYLPHTWDDQRSMRFIATNEAESYTIGEYIRGQIEDETEDKKDLQKILKKRPYYVIFVLDQKLFDSHEVFKQLLQADENPGVSIITARDALPKESQKIIMLQNRMCNTCTTMGVDGGEDENFAAEELSSDSFKKTMHRLSNISLKKTDQAQAMPKMVTFLEMFKVGRVEQLNPLKRWHQNNPAKSLAAPVGVGEDGSLFMLDLHEKRQGPHGLVAGMTGSGKSEFIITYILSMAVNYHPDEVSFVLIDYKGGGLADAFDNPRTGVRLPHLAGTITNLDGASIQRSLMSIESELIRRQKVFSEISKAFDLGSMNIYAYQKLYRAGKVSEPMPHLFVISDEFAELKQQQPEFMDKLISAARIGRSLGVHLILATQKPSGVVNDQIRSNTKFRVCLRVQERSDSQDMLKRPEAAELTDTGRFYLQVGYNEYFALGQSAWCGADYEPQDNIPVRRDDAVEFLDTAGQVIASVKPKAKKTASGMKQIVAVVQYLSELAKNQGIASRPLWKTPLATSLDLHPLNPLDSEHPMTLQLGMLDDPKNLKQFPMSVDFETCGNLLIVGGGTGGKTIIVNNILFTLAQRLGPDAFHFYALDYSSRMLKLYNALPHCGGILQEEDAASLDEFFKLINGVIAKRKRLFSELEVDKFREASARVKLPLVLVVIDNLAGLSSSKQGETIFHKLQFYLKNSAVYGVKYVVTCGHLNEAPARIRQEFSQRICLSLRDKYDYSEILGCPVNYTPAQQPGRGLCKIGDSPLEFQSAIIRAGSSDDARTAWIKEEIQTLCQKYANCAGAQRMPEYSETATYQDFARQFRQGRIPLGYAKHNGKPVALPLKQFSALSFYFGNPMGTRPVLENLIFAAVRENMEVWIVKRSQDSVFDDGIGIPLPESARVFTPDTASLDELRTLLSGRVKQCQTVLQTYCDENHLPGTLREHYKDTFGYLCQSVTPVFLLFEAYAQFCNAIDAIRGLIFDKLLTDAQLYHVYAVGCFEPDDHEGIKNKLLYNGFNPNANVILLGGQFQKQRLCELPQEAATEKLLQCNAGIMSYQSNYYPLLMPCGNISAEAPDEDEQSIF